MCGARPISFSHWGKAFQVACSEPKNAVAQRLIITAVGILVPDQVFIRQRIGRRWVYIPRPIMMQQSAQAEPARDWYKHEPHPSVRMQEAGWRRQCIEQQCCSCTALFLCGCGCTAGFGFSEHSVCQRLLPLKTKIFRRYYEKKISRVLIEMCIISHVQPRNLYS